MPNMARKTGSKSGRKRKRSDWKPSGRKAGRPSNYDEKKHCEIAFLAGLCDETAGKLAERCKIDDATLYVWFKKYPKFYEKWCKGKEAMPQAAHKSLYLKIKGYRYKETKEREFNGQISKETTTKVAHPDTSAIELLFRRMDKYAEGGNKEQFSQVLDYMASLDKNAFSNAVAKFNEKSQDKADESKES